MGFDELRRQWQYWTETEMKWVAETGIPHYQSTSDHHTYDFPSEQVFREVHAHLPQNGRGEERGLAYAVRNGNLVNISTHQPDRTRPFRRDMQIDTNWLDAMLTEHTDARFKLVSGHYPVYPVNGYGLAPQWCFREDEREVFRLIPQAGFGQQMWRGPRLPEEEAFDVSIALHPGLGPGRVLSQSGGSAAWSSCFSSSSKGGEDLAWPSLWTLGQGLNGPDSEPFCGRDLMITAIREALLSVQSP